MRNNQSKICLGILCFSVGAATFLNNILPGWIWSTLTAIILLGCGAVLLFYSG